MNIKNRNISFVFGILILIIVFLFFQINFIGSQELTEITEISSTDFTYSGVGYELSQNGEIIFNGDDSKLIINQGKENEIVIEGNSGVKVSPLGKISVTESGSEFSLDGKNFKNIKSGEIEFDKNTGEITQADFFTNENLGNYNINGNEFNVPANQRFVYNSKKGFELPGETEILEAKNTQIKSDGILNYKENKISGTLNFDENGNAFVKLREEAVINGVSIKNSVPSSYRGSGKGDELMVSFNKNDPNLKDFKEYVILDTEKNYFEYTNQKVGPRTAGKQTLIKFEEGNFFYGDIFDGEKDYLGIDAGTGAHGTLSISRPSKDVLPILEVKEVAEISLLQDSSTVSFGEHISFSQNKIGKLGTVPMRIEFKNKEVVGLIPDDSWKIEGKEAGKYILWSGKTELVGSTFGGSGVGGVGQLSYIEEERLKEWIANSEVRVDLAENIYAMAIDPSFAQSLKDSRDATSFLENMYGNKKIGLSEVIEKTAGSKNIGAIKNLQNNLEEKIINQNEFYNQINSLNKQGVDTEVSFDNLDKIIGTKNTQNLKDNIGKKMESYFSYFQKTGDKTYLLRVAGQNEIDSIKNCVGRGNSFNNCFNQNYNFYGAKTDLCIKSRKYCPILNAGEISRVLF
ncbi:MAG: hypothetical protein AABX80_02340 [Nanoarchaeota archaeon]